MATQVVQSRGIYHGLPAYPDDVQGLTAIVTGANGISGYHMLKVLSEAPRRWKKIYCLSRRPPVVAGGLPANAEFIACDFLQEPETIAEVLRRQNVQADHVFFFSYVQPPPKEGGGLWSDVDELVRVNVALLENFLSALEHADITPKRIMLQTGGKNYGLHLGSVKTPCEEWDPRVTVEPNFYYPQEDLLWSYCKRRGIGWNVVMPAAILGAVPDAAMNLCFPLAIYAAVRAHRRQPLVFPGDVRAWRNTQFQSSAVLNSYLEEWAVLSDRAENQRFNAVDNSGFSPEAFWPKLAGWYGIEWEAPGVYGDQSALTQVAYGPEVPPRGYGPQSDIKFLFQFADWAKEPEVQQAWEEIAKQHDLSFKELKDVDRIFGFADSMLAGEGYFISADKARKLGWHGFVDSSESILQVFDDFAELKMIPPVPKVRVKFL